MPDGHFYSQTGEDTGRGFVVYDDTEANFWTAFQSEGGVFTLGFPVSNRYRFKGLPTQAFQKAILQWDSVRGRANFLNTLDELGLADIIDWSTSAIDSCSVRALFGGRRPGQTLQSAGTTAVNAT